MMFDLDPDTASFYLLLAVLGLLTLVPLWHRWKQGRLDPFEPAVWLSSYSLLVFGLGSIPLLNGWVPWQYRPSPASYWLCRAMGAVVIGIAFLWIGYTLPPSRARRLVPLSLCPDQTVKLPWILATSGIGIGLRIYMVAKGYFGYLMVRSAYFGSLAESQTVSQLSILSEFGFVLAAIDFYRHPHSARRRTLFLVLLLIELVTAAVEGFKGPVLFTGLMVIITYFYIQGRFPTGYLILAVLAVTAFTPINLAYRDLINRGRVDSTDVLTVGATAASVSGNLYQQRGPGQLLLEGGLDLSRRLALLPDVALVMDYVDRTGDLWYGKTYIYLPLYAVVPRYLWPDKPISELGYWFSYAVLGNPRSEHQSEALMLPGELYLNFGLPGVCVGFLLLGLFLRFVYQRYALRGDLSYLFVYIMLWQNLKTLEFDLLPWGAGLIRQVALLLIIRRFAFAPARRQEKTLAAPVCNQAGKDLHGTLPAIH
jgi:hypothetical protein